jgi:hypothetical protein
MRFATLGPTGSCHEYVTKEYIRHFAIPDAEIILIDDFLKGIEMVHDREADYLVQNSAHPLVCEVAEKYIREIPAVDGFIHPTQEMVILEYANVERPRTLGLVKATEGYFWDLDYPEKTYEISKPVVGENLMAGKYEAGLTYMRYHTENPGRFRVRKFIGAVRTVWVVYGWGDAFNGPLMSTLPRNHFTNISERIPHIGAGSVTAASVD